MASTKLIVAYPQPKDLDAFEAVYLQRREPASRNAWAYFSNLGGPATPMKLSDTDADRRHEAMVDLIASTPGAVLDYAAVVDADSLQPLARLVPDRPLLLALAVTLAIRVPMVVNLSTVIAMITCRHQGRLIRPLRS